MKIRMLEFFKFLSFNPNIQRSINWRKKIVQQNLKDYFKGEILIFEIAVHLIINKIFQSFLQTLEFL